MEWFSHNFSSAVNRIIKPGLARDLVSGGIGNVAIKIAQVLIAVVLSAVLARALGPADFGVYAYVFTLVSVLIIPAQFGLPKLLIRETSAAQALDRLGLVRGVWTWSLWVGLASTAVVALLAFAVVFSLRDQLSTEAYFTALFGVALLPLMTLSRLVGGSLRGLRKVIAGQAPDVLFRPGILCLMVLAVVWGYDLPLSAPRAMQFHVIAAAISMLVGVLMLSRSRPRGLLSAAQPVYHSRAWFTAVVPFIWITGTQQINQYADILMLGVFGTSEQVGIYRVAVQAGLLSIVGLQAVQMLAQPYIARLHGRGDTQRLKRLLAASSRGAFCFALLAFIMLALFGRQLISFVFGPLYVDCYVPLLILTAGQLVSSFFGVVDFLLEMTGYQKDSARAFLVGAGCNIGLNLILIPWLGMIGAATATAISIVVSKIVLWNTARRRLRLNTAAFSQFSLSIKADR